MRTIRTKVYKFNELSEAAQAVAIEKQRETNEVFLDFFKEDAERQIQEAGFYDEIQLQYSLGYSQGDGLSFSCKRFETEKLLPLFAEIMGAGKETSAKAIIEYCEFVCTGNKGHYAYAAKSDIDFTFDKYSNSYIRINELCGKVCEKLESIYMELCKSLEKQGYEDIEYQNSDEAIKETIISNEWEYTANGHFFSN